MGLAARVREVEKDVAAAGLAVTVMEGAGHVVGLGVRARAVGLSAREEVDLAVVGFVAMATEGAG